MSNQPPNGTAEKSLGAEVGTPLPHPWSEVRSVQVIAFLVAIAFFFGLPIFALWGYGLACADRYLLYVPFVFGAAFSSYYFGSYVTVISDARISPTTTLKITAAGSAACAGLAGWIGYQVFLPQSCEPPKAYVHILQLPNKTVDQSPYDVWNKHWPLAPRDKVDDQFVRGFGYQIEISGDHDVPIMVQLNKNSVKYFCNLSIKVHEDNLNNSDLVSTNTDIIKHGRQNGKVYELTFSKNLESTNNKDKIQTHSYDDCFETTEGFKVKSIDIYPNAIKFII